MKIHGIVSAACFILLAGCVNANAERGSDSTAATEGEVSVEFRMENAQGNAARRFAPGETVRFVFDVKNHAARAQLLAYTFPPHRVKVSIQAGAEPVWQAWQGQMFPQVMRNTSLAANSSETFAVDWTIDVDIASGTYKVQPAFHGFVDDQPVSQAISPVTITIK